MHRIDTLTRAIGLFGAGKDGWVDGNMAMGIPATQINAAWMNSVQEEIAKVIEAAGLTLNSSNNAQLLAAINALSNNISFPSGTRMVFAQASAPTGWTQDTSDAANNRMLRVVITGGGATGGSADPTVNNVVPAHTHSFTTGNESATHTHALTDPGHSHAPLIGSNFITNPGDWNGVGGGTLGKFAGGTTTASASTGITAGTESVNHNHSGSTDNGSSSTNWTPRYNSVIICIKN